jgi:transposase
MVTVREAGRRPVETGQWYLQTVHGLDRSAGASVAAQRLVAQRGQAAVAAIREPIQTRPVVHVAETGWRENGQHGYLWTCSTPTAQSVCYGRRARTMVTATLGDPFPGTLVTACYVAANHHAGPHHRCWAHRLRDSEAGTAAHPDDGPLHRWAVRGTWLVEQATTVTSADDQVRQRTPRRFAQRRRRLGQPCVADATAVAGPLCRRSERCSKPLFVVVADPTVPPSNNLAERSLRPPVTARKISGGTRAAVGTATTTTVTTLFGTWRLQGLHPLHQCRHLLTSAHL